MKKVSINQMEKPHEKTKTVKTNKEKINESCTKIA